MYNEYIISLIIASKTNGNGIECLVLIRITSIIVIGWVPETLGSDSDSLATEFPQTHLET